ncbi:unnamed protein product [Brachionus calyciflorus]|uniref:C2H2-type domain-containing protein n=1 Tax=Brachionus calyciflorus TaxID=104777 RepID=A0A814NSQ7_9BILA|nr:unnamed protein product [Brachionus calyciflorus]
MHQTNLILYLNGIKQQTFNSEFKQQIAKSNENFKSRISFFCSKCRRYFAHRNKLRIHLKTKCPNGYSIEIINIKSYPIVVYDSTQIVHNLHTIQNELIRSFSNLSLISTMTFMM